MPDELLEDLHDLHAALEQVFWAIACNDPNEIAQAQDEALKLIQCLAVLHCEIVQKTLADQRRINRQMGMRSILVPLNWEGNFYVTKPQKP